MTTTDVRPPFHLAIPVSDLQTSLMFYEGMLGCERGRESADWVDLNFYGHQLVLHQVTTSERHSASKPVDGEEVPVPHFGVVLPWPDFESLGEQLASQAAVFEIPPTTRFAGRVGEQRTFFLRDPSGNCLEFKAFRDPSRLFAADLETYR
ncbi:VOC family protein [Luminiphilus sp.]|nr:VOC family protein [Luminiphilus sp.]